MCAIFFGRRMWLSVTPRRRGKLAVKGVRWQVRSRHTIWSCISLTRKQICSHPDRGSRWCHDNMTMKQTESSNSHATRTHILQNLLQVSTKTDAGSFAGRHAFKLVEFKLASCLPGPDLAHQNVMHSPRWANCCKIIVAILPHASALRITASRWRFGPVYLTSA